MKLNEELKHKFCLKGNQLKIILKALEREKSSYVEQLEHAIKTSSDQFTAIQGFKETSDLITMLQQEAN